MSKENVKAINIPEKERALRFADDAAFTKAVTHLWRQQPFELGGWHCLIVGNNVAKDLLYRFSGEEVKEIELVDLADAPKEVVLEVHAKKWVST